MVCHRQGGRHRFRYLPDVCAAAFARRAAGGTNQANTVLFDIQPDQREAVVQLVRSQNLPVLDEAPIITMRLASVKGRTVESILADKQNQIPRWSLRHEYRSTYNDKLRDGE